MFVAADIMESDGRSAVHWPAVDVVTDRNSLRKLLAYVQDAPPPKDFRIDLQLAGNWTVMFLRWEEKTAEVSGFKGYGDSFERAVTEPAPGCERATLAGHHRVVKYVRRVSYGCAVAWLTCISHDRTSMGSTWLYGAKSMHAMRRKTKSTNCQMLERTL